MSHQRKLDPVAEAKAVLKENNIKTFPVPVEKIAKSLGADLRFQPMDDELSGMIYIKDNVPIIGINALHHPNRQRFTIAHECGHLRMHKQEITSAVHVDKQFPMLWRDTVSSTATNSIEIQANQFAAELLMPRELLEKSLAEIKFDIDDGEPLEKLAKKLKVSKQALEYRIRNLPSK